VGLVLSLDPYADSHGLKVDVYVRGYALQRTPYDVFRDCTDPGRVGSSKLKFTNRNKRGRIGNRLHLGPDRSSGTVINSGPCHTHEDRQRQRKCYHDIAFVAGDTAKACPGAARYKTLEH
jgi:hypothetical protein